MMKRLAVYFPLFYQIIRFGIVGTTAAAVHFGIVVSLVEIGLMQPLAANVIAFMMGFQVSYWGHRHWTFSGTKVYHRVAMMRLFVIAVSNFMVNQTLFFIFFKLVGMPYMLALVLVLAILPVVTFTLGKLWVFR